MKQPEPTPKPSEQLEFPPAPAWAVGADAEHTGPSGMGPGKDQPGFGQEVDEEDAAGVTGVLLADEQEANPQGKPVDPFYARVRTKRKAPKTAGC